MNGTIKLTLKSLQIEGRFFVSFYLLFGIPNTHVWAWIAQSL